MWAVAVEVWIGNAAAVLSGCWGAVTRRVLMKWTRPYADWLE